MSERIPQSVAKRVVLYAYSNVDHLTPATGKTIACTISKNGGAYANPSGGATNATEIGNGSYYVDLSTTDTGTAGPLLVYGTNADIDPVKVPPMEVVNAHNAGFDGVPNAVAGASTGLLISGSNAGTTTLAALTVTGATTLTGGLAGSMDGTITYQQGFQAMLAVLQGASSGFNNSTGVAGAVFKNPGGTKNRVTATTDSSGNRTAITNDFT